MQPRNITITLTYIGQTLAKLTNIMKTNATSDSRSRKSALVTDVMPV